MAKERLSHEERATRRKEIAQEVKKTKDPAAVMKKFGVTYNWVRTACRENQVECPPLPKAARGMVAGRTLEIIAQLILSQKTGSPKQDEIAAQFELTPQRVSMIKKQATEAGLLGPKAVWK